MSEIEDRLRSALNARAELVRPEDLSLNPVYEPEEPEVGHWWQRPGTFLFVAAVAVIVIALPLLALAAAGPGENRTDPDPAQSGTPDMIDPVRPAGAHDEADVDGDGTDDEIDVVSTTVTGASFPDYRLDVALSTTGTTVSYDVGEVSSAGIGATANVDGRRGEEVVLALESDTIDPHRAVPQVVSLRDGRLEQILTDDLAVEDGTLTYWWVDHGELWWWQSQEPQEAGGDTPYPVDVARFPAEATLQGEPQGTSCVTWTMPQTLSDCDGGEPPSTDGTDPVTPPTSDTWWDETVEGMPAEWFTERSVDVGTSLEGDLDGDGTTDQFRITGSSGNAWLQAETDGQSLTAPVPGGDPSLEGLVELDGWDAPVIVGHSMEGAAGTTHATWFAFVVAGDELVPLDLTSGGPSFSSERSNLTTDEGGHPTELTWRLDETSLFSMDYLDKGEYVGPDGTDVWVYIVRVRSWYVEGSLLRATTLGQACVAPEVGSGFYACPPGLDFPG